MVCKYGCNYFWGNNLHPPKKFRQFLWFHRMPSFLFQPFKSFAETEAMLTYIGCRQREMQVVILNQSRGGLRQRILFWLLAAECASLSQQFTDDRALTSGPNWTHSWATKSSSSWFVSSASYFSSSSWWSCCLPPPRGVFTSRRHCIHRLHAHADKDLSSSPQFSSHTSTARRWIKLRSKWCSPQGPLCGGRGAREQWEIAFQHKGTVAPYRSGHCSWHLRVKHHHRCVHSTCKHLAVGRTFIHGCRPCSLVYLSVYASINFSVSSSEHRVQQW
jgi:hypothetical protein